MGYERKSLSDIIGVPKETLSRTEKEIFHEEYLSKQFKERWTEEEIKLFLKNNRFDDEELLSIIRDKEKNSKELASLLVGMSDEDLLNNVIRTDEFKFKFLKERLNGKLTTIYPYTLSDSVIMTETEQSLTQFISDLVNYIDNNIADKSVNLLNYYTITQMSLILGYPIDECAKIVDSNYKPDEERILSIGARLEALENGRETGQDVFSDPIMENNECLTTEIPNTLLANSALFDEKL